MNTQDVNRIVGHRPSVIAPNVQPDEAGCRCYLATASDAGFRFVKMEQTPDKQKCNEIKIKQTLKRKHKKLIMIFQFKNHLKNQNALLIFGVNF